MEQKVNCIFGGKLQERKERIERYISLVNKEDIYHGYPMDKCIRHTTDDVLIIKLDDQEGCVLIEKPNINTYMGTGYSDIGQGPTHQEAIRLSNEKQKDPSYFINHNINYSDIKRYLDKLDEVKKGHVNLYIRNYTTKLPKESKIKCLMFFNPLRDNFRLEQQTPYNLVQITDPKLINQIAQAYEQALERFKKRLNTYLKKFGLKKCNFDVFWMDR